MRSLSPSYGLGLLFIVLVTVILEHRIDGSTIPLYRRELRFPVFVNVHWFDAFRLIASLTNDMGKEAMVVSDDLVE
jgi:hypothetical protein